MCGYFTKETKTEAIKLEKMIRRDGHIQYWLCHPTFTAVICQGSSVVEQRPEKPCVGSSILPLGKSLVSAAGFCLLAPVVWYWKEMGV